MSEFLQTIKYLAESDIDYYFTNNVVSKEKCFADLNKMMSKCIFTCYLKENLYTFMKRN